MKSGPYVSATNAEASAIMPGSAPKIWMPIGCSSESKRRYSRERGDPMTIPVALTNSLTTTSAP